MRGATKTYFREKHCFLKKGVEIRAFDGNVFDACRSITRASGRGLVPGEIKSFLGHVVWHRAYRRVPFGGFMYKSPRVTLTGCKGVSQGVTRAYSAICKEKREGYITGWAEALEILR